LTAGVCGFRGWDAIISAADAAHIASATRLRTSRVDACGTWGVARGAGHWGLAGHSGATGHCGSWEPAAGGAA
jgi:hypothetical protein